MVQRLDIDDVCQAYVQAYQDDSSNLQLWQGPQDIILPDILGRENQRCISIPDFVNILICDMRGEGGGGGGGATL